MVGVERTELGGVVCGVSVIGAGGGGDGRPKRRLPSRPRSKVVKRQVEPTTGKVVTGAEFERRRHNARVDEALQRIDALLSSTSVGHLAASPVKGKRTEVDFSSTLVPAASLSRGAGLVPPPPPETFPVATIPDLARQQALEEAGIGADPRRPPYARESFERKIMGLRIDNWKSQGGAEQGKKEKTDGQPELARAMLQALIPEVPSLARGRGRKG